MTRLIDDGSACSRTLALGRTFQWQWHLHFSPLGLQVLAVVTSSEQFQAILGAVDGADLIRSGALKACVCACACLCPV